jgi:site-specific DNA-methyltransferase (adenine-specific)
VSDLKNDALLAKKKFSTSIQEAQEYIENFDILETINNVGNDEVFTPLKICNEVLDLLPNEVWENPQYKWLNPVDKNGVFLREIAIRLDKGLLYWEPNAEKRKKHILQNMLYSIGLTRFTSQVSRRTVYYCSVANKIFDGLTDNNGNSINGYSIGNGSWFKDSEGNIKTPNTDHTFHNNKCEFCGILKYDSAGKYGKYADPKQIEHYAYEFIHSKDTFSNLQNRFFKGDKTMKFDIIIGNPPYQLSLGTKGGNKSLSKQIFPDFIEQAILLNPKYFSFIIPARWFTGDAQDKSFLKLREFIKNNNHISDLVYYRNYKDVFPNNVIKGGVCYFLHKRDYEGDVRFTEVEENQKNTVKRPLFEENNNVIYSSYKFISILNKVKNKNFQSITAITNGRNAFGIVGKEEELNKFTKEKPFQNSYSVYIKGKQIRFIAKNSDKLENLDLIKKYKVFVSKSAGDPIDDNKIIGMPFLGEPGTLCSDTYIPIGFFSEEKQASNLLKYLKTKFVRFLISTLKASQNVYQNVYQNVPLQEFSSEYNDEDLYKKYSLSIDEIKYIEDTIEEMK